MFCFRNPIDSIRRVKFDRNSPVEYVYKKRACFGNPFPFPLVLLMTLCILPLFGRQVQQQFLKQVSNHCA